MVFVVIEGANGVGKATQTTLLTDKLKEMGKITETFSFPTKNHRSSTFIDKFQAGELGHPESVDPYIASIYDSIDIFAHYATLAKKIDVYDVVIAEKYIISSFLQR
jgi:dTMP kinase